jgi:hypothetical protein
VTLASIECFCIFTKVQDLLGVHFTSTNWSTKGVAKMTRSCQNDVASHAGCLSVDCHFFVANTFLQCSVPTA